MKNTILFFFLILFTVNIFGQNPSLEFKAKYQQAKIDIKNKQYEKAKKQLEILQSQGLANGYMPYISYYTGLCNYKLNDYKSAEYQLNNLNEKHKNWVKQDDVNYLLGLINLAKKEPEKALNNFNSNNSKEIDKQALNHLDKYFRINYDKNSIKSYIEKYPKFAPLKNIINEKESKNVYDLAPNEIPILAEKPAINFNKGYYNFGLLFPFNLDSSSNERLNNQYIYDFYDGMRIAVEKLKTERINVKLHAYEVEKGKREMLALIKNKEFLKEDILIGPFYMEPNKIAQYYANESNVALINPLSRNSDLVKQKPYSFLNKSGNQALAKQIVKFIGNNFYGETAIITSNADTSLVNLVSQELRKANAKFSIIKFQNAESLSILEKKKLASIIYLGNSKVSQIVFNSIDKKLGLVPIITHHDFISDNTVSQNKWNEIYIFNQDYVDEGNENVQNFKNQYWSKRANLPSVYTYKGYDLVLYWGRQMAKFKENYTIASFTALDEDYLVNSFNYSVLSNENAAFTVTIAQNGTETIYKKL